jgi:hypothetical protein
VPVTITAPGLAELYQGKRRVWRGAAPSEVLAALADVIEDQVQASGIYELRLGPSSVSYTAPVIGTISARAALP